MRVNDLYKLTGICPQTIRVGLQQQLFPFGTAFKLPGNKKYTYVLYPEKVKEYFGLTEEDLKKLKEESDE